MRTKDKSKTPKREGISKRLRFEVFKRDAFTCQYCGRKAPDVILEVDHIEPVSKGGKTDILNLVTSCYDCNRGKSNVKLSDDSVVERQKKQLVELNEKREQLKMLLKWRSGLLKIESEKINALQDNWIKTTGYSLNENGIAELKKLLGQFGIASILEAMDIATKYLQYKNDKITHESVEFAFNKLKGICYIRSLPEEQRKVYQIIGEIKKLMFYKFGYYYDAQNAAILINKFIKSGYSIDDLKNIVDSTKTYIEWHEVINSHL